MGPLKGIPVGASHNSISFGMGGPDQLAVALQVWQESTRIDANERYEAMRAQYPNAEDTTGLTAKTLFSYWNDLMTLTFLDFTRRMVISVTCNQSVCSQKQLLELTKLVQSRM